MNGLLLVSLQLTFASFGLCPAKADAVCGSCISLLCSFVLTAPVARFRCCAFLLCSGKVHDLCGTLWRIETTESLVIILM